MDKGAEGAWAGFYFDTHCQALGTKYYVIGLLLKYFWYKKSEFYNQE